MSFNYGSKSRHRSSGRHFKLFSDELPRIEFDKASLEEYNNAANEKRRSKIKRKTIRDFHHDRFSLPSLGTPELDRLSDTERTRPQSFSPFNLLNPNFAKIQQKIQRRHTLRETKSTDWDGPVENLRTNDNVNKQQYTNAWNENIRKSKPEKHHHQVHTPGHDSLNTDEANTSVDSLNNVLVEKPPVPKKKSLLRELLDASAKENARMNKIKEGLKFKVSKYHGNSSVKPYKEPSVGKSDSEDQGINDSCKVDTSAPEVIFETHENAKPGILKHGVRIKEENFTKTLTKRDFYLKPRLVHQEDLPLFGQDGSNETGASNDEVRVSIYADTPLNRINDMVFVPLPSTKTKDKQKRVNFHDHVDVKERTALSELTDVDTENHLNVEVESKKVFDSKQEDFKIENKKTSAPIRRRSNVRYGDTSKSLKDHTFTIEQRHDSEDKPKVRKNTFNYDNSYKTRRHIAHDGSKQDSIDSIFLSSKPDNHILVDKRTTSVWKEARPAVSEVLIHAPDPVEVITIANSPEQLASLHAEKVISRNKARDYPHISMLNISDSGLIKAQNFPRSPPTSPHRSPPKSPDIDTLSDYTMLFDDELDIDDLPEDIDRSMLGEDLIKAYRFWDRKRKAFPGGLRKIEAPVDRHDSLYPKQYSNVKTYKITNQRLEKQPVAHTHNKSILSSVLMDWV